MRVAEQLDADAKAFHCAAVLELSGPIDPELLGRAVAHAVDDAEALRVRFAEHDDRLTLHVQSCEEARTAGELSVADFRAHSDPAAAADAWAAARLAEAPAMLGPAPLVSHGLMRLGNDRNRLFLSYHHALLDGYGQSLHTARIAEIYTALEAGTPIPPSRAGTLAALVEEDAAYASSSSFERDRRYWRETVSGLTTPQARSHSGSASPLHSRGPSARSRRALLEAARAARVPWAIMAIALGAAHRRTTTGEDETMLGLPVAARLGRTALTTPACSPTNCRCASPSAAGRHSATWWTKCGARSASLLRHQRYRGEDLHHELGRSSGTGGFGGLTLNVMSFARAIRFGGAEAVTDQLSTGPVRGLAVNIQGRADGEGGLAVDLHADGNAYREDELSDFRAGFVHYLQHAPADLGRRVGSLDPRPAGTRTKPLRASPPCVRPAPAASPGLRGAGRRRPRRGRPHQRHPHPHRRRTQRRRQPPGPPPARTGRGPRVRGRSPPAPLPEQVTAVLAVLKAGAAYLPLDPAYPAERTAYVLGDARPSLVITTARLAGALPPSPPESSSSMTPTCWTPCPPRPRPT
ncbi:condensation domain-containing protein [Streptomyces sp. M10(2022)]